MPGLSRDRSDYYRSYLLRLNVRARLTAAGALVRRRVAPRLAFVAGCGRSGTSILGEILSLHPEVAYLFEPADRWAMADPRTDIWRRYRPFSRHRALLDGEDVTTDVRRRFERLWAGRPDRLTIDKSPEHCLRLPYLHRLAPDARFVVIARDGAEVAASIEQMARRSHPILRGRRYNEWWGLEDAKWHAIAAAAERLGFARADIDRVRGDRARGAVEWLVSTRALDRARVAVSGRLLEIGYPSLVGQPATTVADVARFLSLEPDPGWVAAAAARVRATFRDTPPVVLPAALAEEFNAVQARHRFTGVADAA